LNSDKSVWFGALYCDLIVFSLLIHSTALLSKVNKDPVYQTNLHFLKRSNSFEKDFEIQFTPSCISTKTVSYKEVICENAFQKCFSKVN